MLQGCRPCWWCRERLGVLEHFAGGEGGALGVHNHCRGGGKRVPGHWGSCFWGAWVRTARGWGVPRHARRGWGCLRVLDRGRAAGGLSGSRVQRGIGSGWPCWGCRRGPAPRGGGTEQPPLTCSPCSLGTCLLCSSSALFPMRIFWTPSGAYWAGEQSKDSPTHTAGGPPDLPSCTPHLIHVAGPLHDVLVGALTADVVHEEDALQGVGGWPLTP